METPAGTLLIRPATEADAASIAAIWNPLIRDTLVTFTTLEKTPEAIVALVAEREAAGHPVLVAELEARVAGFASYGQFRAGPGYARTMEHSINLAPEARGRGVGRALMSRLEDQARRARVHSLFAGVSSANPAGIAFHARLGYREVAVLPEVGYKFGRWLDLHLMQKMLAPAEGAGEDPAGGGDTLTRTADIARRSR